ncbi:MAG: twin-arginine translocase subunit TatC [Acidobacteriota bacterium]
MDTATTPESTESPIAWDSVIERIDEVRRRLVWVVITLLVGTGAAWGIADRAFAFLAAPLTRALAEAGRDPRLVFTRLTDPFIIYFSVSLLVGVLITVPVLMALVWRMMVPLGLGRGLLKAAAFVISSTLLFAAGLAFGYWVLLPFAVRYLLQVAQDFEYAVTIREYLRFALRMLLAMGVSAQLPLLSFVAARFGLVSAARMVRWLPYAVLLAFVVAAVVTPPDGASQVLVAVPMVALYLLGVLVAALTTRRRD